MLKKNLYFYTVLFVIGMFGYGIIEILWRGYTHISMGLAGGIAFCCLAIIEENFKDLKLLYRCILGGITITAIELIFGFIFNIKFGQNVWDYSHIPLNYKGQICFLFTCLWCFLTIPFFRLTKIIRQNIYGRNFDKIR